MAIQIASIGLIWLAIRLRVLWPSQENHRLWMGSLVPLALVATLLLRLTARGAPTRRRLWI